MSDLALMSIRDLSEEIRALRVSPVEVTRAALDRILAYDETLRAYISVYEESALEAARTAEAEIREGHRRGPLHGIPLGLKDNLYCGGLITTMGSKIHRDFVPDFSATVVDRLAEAGAVTLGKLNMHEYALGGTTDNVTFGTCRNPWDLGKSPGGSSGGSAVATATGMAVGTLGTDTSGSIRIPAAMCGIVGFKPTYGRVGKTGCFPEAWSLDHIGPMTRTVWDAAVVLDAISGHDSSDAASLPLAATTAARDLQPDCRGLAIGINEAFFFSEVDKQISDRVWDAIRSLEEQGARLVDVDVPLLEHCEYALAIIDTSETTAVHHSNLVSRPQDYADDVRILLECGELPSAVEYLEAQQVRGRLRAAMSEIFRTVDVIIGPTLPIRTPHIGSDVAFIDEREVDSIQNMMRLLAPGSLLGLPSLSMPCGLVDGMPVGIQVLGPAQEDQRVLNVALAIERLDLMARSEPKAYVTASEGTRA